MMGSYKISILHKTNFLKVIFKYLFACDHHKLSKLDKSGYLKICNSVNFWGIRMLLL